MRAEAASSSNRQAAETPFASDLYVMSNPRIAGELKVGRSNNAEMRRCALVAREKTVAGSRRVQTAWESSDPERAAWARWTATRRTLFDDVAVEDDGVGVVFATVANGEIASDYYHLLILLLLKQKSIFNKK